MNDAYNEETNSEEERSEDEVPRFMDLISYRRKNNRGARTKLDEQKIEFASQLIAKGCTVPDTAYLIGISERTWYRWRAKGDDLIRYIENCEKGGDIPILREDDELYVEFADRISIALPYRKLKLRGVIEAAANDGKNWTAAAWMLERQYPDEYSRKTRVEHSWENELIPLIQKGDITFEMIEEKTDEQTARRLFESAGKEIPATISNDKHNQEG